ncbi:Tim44 domain-containing protein [Falsiroseomonas stagni]|uniref:Predicted lipid-binding transport protein, Tim44 family n=1 Tax=Falsiroseomonas stagni DSM 19981 TaxID=1123062 RepID=A0A1I4DQE0_9PROT|nr:TIM44-like domain-containing protein [Falsiroseomonas stagni]SFK95585.1 Predicted lipid-binding transport protein, Tim44 family [Falsiroseomonas stagni DSM 19981]
MRRTARVMTALAVVALALGPALAEAKPGGNSSSGSRGSRTQMAPPATQTAPGGAQQMQRTQQAPAPAANPATSAARPGVPAAAQGSFFSRNPMMAGLMGGLLGAGLFGLLSGSGLFGGMAGFASILGLLLQVALIGGLVYLVMRLVRGARRPAVAAGPAGYARDMNGGDDGRRPLNPGAMGMGAMAGGAAAAVASKPIQVAPADFETFGQALLDVNAAWSRQDLEALRRLSTPEMTNYFAQDLSDLRARGWTNTTSDVRLEAGDLSEAWEENGQHYATVTMRFSLIDVTRAADGTVVEGHPTNRSTSTEFWTFVRSPGEAWRLSAIQQTA